MAHNQIGNKCSSIAKNYAFRNLRQLNLSANKIGDKGATAIGKNLKWIHLEELFLHDNEIGDDGAIAISHNKVWKKLAKFEIQMNVFIIKIGRESLKKNPIFGSFVHFDQ